MSDVLFVPSWLRWPPNCCETCCGWSPDKNQIYNGICCNSESLEVGTHTDSRFRCPAFKRKDGV